MALFAAAKKKIEKASHGDLEAKLGNCLWMSLCAAPLKAFSHLAIEDCAVIRDIHNLCGHRRPLRFQEEKNI
ncbi:hypothetical protein QFC20_007801 [Naganishia adeliensis]|uniref:Uncharacterized protein n=1 Tax=Naganishia adeliensis TaxID=92952 RepID=A0ACC2UVN6_9TREE|nr:hypothetical protein QFC20_007801 [Naganishia adeliensis]